jgi:four helix bundle protein
MPDSERFGLTNQMRRAVVSIPSNIAEGNARQSRKDYIHFLVMARGSLAELETQYVIARELKFIPPDSTLTEAMLEISRMLQGLIASLRRRRD